MAVVFLLDNLENFVECCGSIALGVNVERSLRHYLLLVKRPKSKSSGIILTPRLQSKTIDTFAFQMRSKIGIEQDIGSFRAAICQPRMIAFPILLTHQ